VETKEARKLAAQRAAKEIPNHTTIGLGTGSTVEYFIEHLGQRIQDEGLEISAVTTSFEGQLLARQYGITTLNPMNVSHLDVAIDGTDEVDPNGNLLKGRGAALTREKIVAGMAERYIIVVDEAKMVSQLGEKDPVPVEVIPEAVTLVERLLKKWQRPTAVRPDQSKAGPVVTDLGNLIIDVEFGLIDDARSLSKHINNLPGVVENGLFIDMTDDVILGSIKNGQPQVAKHSFKTGNPHQNSSQPGKQKYQTSGDKNSRKMSTFLLDSPLRGKM
jgi:ribose 5-phosphate isomerase A